MALLVFIDFFTELKALVRSARSRLRGGSRRSPGLSNYPLTPSPAPSPVTLLSGLTITRPITGDGAGSTSAAQAQKKGPAYTSPYYVFCKVSTLVRVR